MTQHSFTTHVLMLALMSLLAQNGFGRATKVAEEIEFTKNSIAENLKFKSIEELEREVLEIDQQLDSLCQISFRTGVGSVGGRSGIGPNANRIEWFQVNLDQQELIDQIVLVPTIWRDTRNGLQADGFPLEFRIVIGDSENEKGTTVARFNKDSNLLPRIAPLVVNCPPTQGSWIRLEATQLTSRVWDSSYLFKLAEVMVFSGQKNVALHQPVTTSSSEFFQAECVVDGFTPYLMDAIEGEKSIGFFMAGIQVVPELVIDLGEIRRFERINLHSLEIGHTIPQLDPDGYGMPREMALEVSNSPGFSNFVKVLDLRLGSPNNFGPVVAKSFPPQNARFVRLKATQPDCFIRNSVRVNRIGFAEIELLLNGKNVALGSKVQANFPVRNPRRPLSALTDGKNMYGTVLPVRDWINQLAKRHDLEALRPLVARELRMRYSRRYTKFVWLSVILAIGIFASVILSHIIRKRELARLLARFSADLHDELGANLHAIGILSDVAQMDSGVSTSQQKLLSQIRALTERSGVAVKYFTKALDAEALYQNLIEEMKRATHRIIADIEGEFSFDGKPAFLEKLNPRQRADLFLFFKECLVNISRHSGATSFSAKLSVDETEICLVVSDNGVGLSQDSAASVPPSLIRRARLLSAQVVVEEAREGGTSIKMTMPHWKNWWRFRKQGK